MYSKVEEEEDCDDDDIAESGWEGASGGRLERFNYRLMMKTSVHY